MSSTTPPVSISVWGESSDSESCTARRRRGRRGQRGNPGVTDNYSQARRRLVRYFVSGLATMFGVVIIPTTSSHGVSATPPVCGVQGLTAHYTHVVWIVMENVGYSVIGSPTAPYLNQLSHQCGLATNELAVAHPSLPNYIALTSGSTQDIADDNEPASHHLHVVNIFSQLSGNWRTYAESMPTSCDHVTSGTYAARHNPAVYYTNLASTCSRNDVALSGKPDFSSAFTLVIPNVCDDMHSCRVALGDQWLRNYVAKVIASPQYRSHQLALFVTWDENDQSAANHVPTIVVAPSVPRGIRVARPFTTYSLLATAEQLLQLPLIGAARTAPAMTAPFHL